MSHDTHPEVTFHVVQRPKGRLLRKGQGQMSFFFANSFFELKSTEGCALRHHTFRLSEELKRGYVCVCVRWTSRKPPMV